MKIILLGYMGSGKSIIGSVLSEKLQVPLLDLDNCIEVKAGMTINSLFDLKGEIYFRKIEHDVFRQLMQSEDAFVLSLGGGTPCYANNHLLLNGDGIFSVYLKTSIDELFRRVKKETQVRPLLADKSDEDLREFIAQHLFERSYFYNQASQAIVTDGKSPAEIAEEIQQLLV